MPARPDSLRTRYLAWLYSPPSQRPVVKALCALESEIAESLRPGLDHHVAHTRLQWWREECERCAQGRPLHPLTRELVSACASGASPLAGLSGLVDTAVWDLAAVTFETRRELTAYGERWAAAVIEPTATHALAALPPSAHRWRALGAALREIEMLRELAPEARAGRLRVPLDELQQAGIDPADLTRPPWRAALSALLRQRHEALRASVAECLGSLTAEEQRQLRGVLVWAALAWQQSWRTQRALPNQVRAPRYHTLTDGWHAWRAARRAITGAYRLT